MMNLLGREIRCPEPDDLKNLALSFAEALKGGEVCLMYGEVGAGKTFFTTALVEALGGDSRMVASPSFTLVNEYDLVKGRVLHHVDLYRLDGVVEEDAIDQEWWMEPEGEDISCVEWAERLGDWRPEQGYALHFSHGDPGRVVRIELLS